MSDGSAPPVDPTWPQLIKMEEASRAAARRYRGSRIPQEELEQAAWVELLKAVQKYDETRGVPFYAYCWRIALSAVRKAVITTRSPVTGSKHRVETVRRAKAVDESEIAEHRAPEYQQPDTALREHQFRRAVQDRVSVLLGEQSVPFALAIGTGDFTPQEIADFNGIPVQHVYRMRAAVRKALFHDYTLFKLWKESI